MVASSTVRAGTHGTTEQSTKDNSYKVKDTAMVIINHQQVSNFRDSTSMISRMVGGISNGKMGRVTRVSLGMM